MCQAAFTKRQVQGLFNRAFLCSRVAVGVSLETVRARIATRGRPYGFASVSKCSSRGSAREAVAPLKCRQWHGRPRRLCLALLSLIAPSVAVSGSILITAAQHCIVTHSRLRSQTLTRPGGYGVRSTVVSANAQN